MLYSIWCIMDSYFGASWLIKKNKCITIQILKINIKLCLTNLKLLVHCSLQKPCAMMVFCHIKQKASLSSRCSMDFGALVVILRKEIWLVNQCDILSTMTMSMLPVAHKGVFGNWEPNLILCAMLSNTLCLRHPYRSTMYGVSI